MSIYVISAEDRQRLDDFLATYRPYLHSEVEQMTLLKKKLRDAVIIPESKLARNIVSMYTTMSVVDLDRREALRYTLVYPRQASTGYCLLSVLSPLGVALLGCSEGSFFECTASEGIMKFAVKEILYQPVWDLRNPHGIAPAS
jgi:transcription elongation GreA/GreB family factor